MSCGAERTLRDWCRREMQSASLTARLKPGRERLWNGARSSMQGGFVCSALLVFLLTFSIARSTATAGWVNGIDVITPIALTGVLLMAVLAVLPVPWPAGLGLGLILSPAVAAVGAWPAIHARFPQEAVNE